MKRLNALIFALMVLLSITISATALEYKTISRQNGVSTYADWTGTNGDVSTYTDLFVMKTDDGADIGVLICKYDTIAGISSCKSGYKFTQDNVFSVDKKLDSASLSEVDIEVYDWDTGATETLKIKADWTGTGDIEKGSFKYMSKYGDYMMKGSDSSSYREATATGSINGNEMGTSGLGGLAKFKSAYMDMKK